MLTHIVHPSPRLCAFLDQLNLPLSQPQQRHLCNLADALQSGDLSDAAGSADDLQLAGDRDQFVRPDRLLAVARDLHHGTVAG